MVEYGVNVSNKFAFLSGDEEEDPAEVLQRAELARKQKAAEPKKDKKVTIAAVAPAPAKVEKQANKENIDQRRTQPRKDQPRGGERPRGPRREGNEHNDVIGDRFGERQTANRGFSGGNRPSGPPGSRGPRGGDRDGAPRSGDGVRRPPRQFTNENRGEHENHTAPEEQRDGAAGRNPGYRGHNNGPRRAFQKNDRISGSDKTGVRSVPKKDGHGKGNWGKENEDNEGETEAVPAETELNKSTENAGANAPVTENTDEVKADQEPEEEKIRELTLEEWKAQHKTEKPQFNTRKPGEGQDAKIYQKLIPLKRDAEEEKEEEEIIYLKREPREKPLNIEVSFNDPQRNRGGSGRGFREDRPPRGGERGAPRGEHEEGPRTGGPPRGYRSGPAAHGGPARPVQQQRYSGAPRAQNFDLSEDSFPSL